MPSTPGGSPSDSQASATSPPLETILATALSHPNLVATYKVSSVRLRDSSSPNTSLPSGPPGEPKVAGEGFEAQLLPGPEGGLPYPTGPSTEVPAAIGAAGLSAGNSGRSGSGSGTCMEAALEEGLCPNGGPSPSTPMPVVDGGQHRQPAAALFETWMVLEASAANMH